MQFQWELVRLIHRRLVAYIQASAFLADGDELIYKFKETMQVEVGI